MWLARAVAVAMNAGFLAWVASVAVSDCRHGLSIDTNAPNEAKRDVR